MDPWKQALARMAAEAAALKAKPEQAALAELAERFVGRLRVALEATSSTPADATIRCKELEALGRKVRGAQAAAALGADLRGALRAVQKLAKDHKATGDAIAQLRAAIGDPSASPAPAGAGPAATSPEAAAEDPTAEASPAAPEGGFAFDPARLEDRETEWLYLTEDAADGELSAEPLADQPGVSVVYAAMPDGTEMQVGYLFDKAQWPEATDVQGWLEQTLGAGAPAEPAEPAGEEPAAAAATPNAGRAAQAGLFTRAELVAAQAGRYAPLRDLLGHVKETFLPYSDHGYPGPLTPDQRILVGSALEAIRDGIHNIHDAEEAKEVPKREGIVDDAGLRTAVTKLAELLETVGAPGTAETMIGILAETPKKAAQAASVLTAPVATSVPMPPGAGAAGVPGAGQKARRLMKRAVAFACLKCTSPIRGERHCPGCGASTTEMLASIAAGEVAAPAAAPAKTTPAPVQSAPPAAAPLARPARRPLAPRAAAPAPVVAPAAAPAPNLVAQQAAISDLVTSLVGASMGELPELEFFLASTRGIKPHQALRDGQKAIKGTLEIDLKQVVIHNRGKDDEWAEARALVLAPGMRRDRKAAFTPECPAKSAQGFANADVWFMHRPEIGKPGSSGVLYDKAGTCVDPVIDGGNLYVTMKVLHPWPISMLKKAQAAGIQDFYEVSFDGLIHAQEVHTPDGRTYDLVHQVFPRSVDFVDKGAVEGARLIPQAAELQEVPMDRDAETTNPAAAPATPKPGGAAPPSSWLTAEDAAFDSKLAYLQNHCDGLMHYDPRVTSGALNFAIDNRAWTVKATAAELMTKAKEFNAQLGMTLTPAQAAQQPAGAQVAAEPTDVIRQTAREFFDKGNPFPKSVHYLLKCAKAALGHANTTPTLEEVETFFPMLAKVSQAKARLSQRTLGLRTVGAQASEHGDEVYIADDRKRGIAAKEITVKALQNGLIRTAKDEKIEASQAAIDMTAIAYAVQDALDISKMERMESVLSGGTGAPASVAISKEKSVDHFTNVHEVEMSAPDVFSAVAELANLSQIAAPSTREWKDKVVLFGGYALISEEARATDHAGVLAELPQLMVEAMLWLEYLAVFSPFLNNSLMQDGSAVFNSTEGNIISVGYTFAQYVNLLVLGSQRVDWSVGSGVNRRHIDWNPVAAVSAPALWAQLIRDTSSADKPDTSDRAANVVTHGFGGIKNFKMPHFASAGYTDRLIVFGDKSKGPIGTMLRYKGMSAPELTILDSKQAGPGMLANAFAIVCRHGFRYFPKSRKNVAAIIP